MTNMQAIEFNSRHYDLTHQFKYLLGLECEESGMIDGFFDLAQDYMTVKKEKLNEEQWCKVFSAIKYFLRAKEEQLDEEEWQNLYEYCQDEILEVQDEKLDEDDWIGLFEGIKGNLPVEEFCSVFCYELFTVAKAHLLIKDKLKKPIKKVRFGGVEILNSQA